MTDNHHPAPKGSAYEPFWTDVPEADWSNPDHIAVFAALTGGHSHLDRLEHLAGHLLSVWSSIHLRSAIEQKPCSEIAQHDEVEAEMTRLHDFVIRARSGVWN